METVDLSLLAGEPIRRMRRVEFEVLAKQGYFDDERVELLFGMVVHMPPIDAAHSESVDRVLLPLLKALEGRARVRAHGAYAASEWSEPQPDVLVMPLGEYWQANPDHAYLVVEVARSSLVRDRGLKAIVYAQGNVDEYWIVDHVHDQIEVLRDPHEGIWRVQTVHKGGDTITLLRFPDVAIAVSDVLPPTA